MKQDNLLSRFSWNRIALCLVHLDKCESIVTKDCIRINLLHHKQSILLYKNGRCILFNPWESDRVNIKYHILAPKDIESIVNQILSIKQAAKFYNLIDQHKHLN